MSMLLSPKVSNVHIYIPHCSWDVDEPLCTWEAYIPICVVVFLFVQCRGHLVALDCSYNTTKALFWVFYPGGEPVLECQVWNTSEYHAGVFVTLRPYMESIVLQLVISFYLHLSWSLGSITIRCPVSVCTGFRCFSSGFVFCFLSFYHCGDLFNIIMQTSSVCWLASS